MKRRKVLSFLTAAVMAASALPISAVSAAEGTYALGDVDMDGVITGHDAAVVSRYLNVDDDLLTEEQKKLADVNEDGIVDQADADWIHENQVFGLGDTNGTGSDTAIGSEAAYYALLYYTLVSAGYDVEIVKEDVSETNLEKDNLFWDITDQQRPTTISELNYNLIDCDGDGKVDTYDAYAALLAGALLGSGLQDKPYFAEDRYDLETDLVPQLMETIIVHD